MNECPNCGSPDVYEECVNVWDGLHDMHCNSCDCSYSIEVGETFVMDAAELPY